MGKKRSIPEGARFGNYFVITEKVNGKETYKIRRRVILPDGQKIEPRYPLKHYKHLTTLEEFNKLVNRLNHREHISSQRNMELRTSFITKEILESFRDHLQINIPSEKDFRYMYNTVFQKYFLKFFIDQKIYDPKEFSLHQEKWAKALLGKSDNPDMNIFNKASAKSIKRTIDLANRFMEHLHIKNPKEYTSVIILNPLSKAALKEHDSALSLSEDDEDPGLFIPDEDWKVINENLPEDIGCFVRLMYFYGLRRAESLGFDNLKVVRRDHLKVSQQLKATKCGNSTYKTLKDKDKRDTPHWFVSPLEAYRLIEQSLTRKMHPDTLYTKWILLMKKLKMPYQLHDLRRTFICNALRVVSPRDTQMAVGHANITTTMLYARDDRNLSNDIFVPPNE